MEVFQQDVTEMKEDWCIILLVENREWVIKDDLWKIACCVFKYHCEWKNGSTNCVIATYILEHLDEMQDIGIKELLKNVMLQWVLFHVFVKK